MERLKKLTAGNKEIQDKINGLKEENKEGARQLEELNKALEELIRREQDETGQAFSPDKFRWPLDAKYKTITTYFGYDPWRGGNHGGIDVWNENGIYGAKIYAAQSGTVLAVVKGCPHDTYGDGRKSPAYCSCGGGWGNYVLIDHGGRISTLYAHCSEIYVKKGDFVDRGDVIGKVGCTGWSTRAHLHFEVRVNGKQTDPMKYKYSRE